MNLLKSSGGTNEHGSPGRTAETEVFFERVRKVGIDAFFLKNVLGPFFLVVVNYSLPT